MNGHFHIDMETLFAAQSLFALIFAVGLFVLRSKFRHLNGISYLGITFLCSAGAAIIFLLRGEMPLVINVVLTQSVMLAANLSFYYGIDTLLGMRPRMLVPSIACGAAVVSAAFFSTTAHNLIAIRIMLFSAAACVVVGYMLADLIRYPRRHTIIRPLLASLVFYLIACILRGIITPILGTAPLYVFPYNVIQAAYLIIGVLSACGLGVFSMALVGSEVAAAIERNARRDPLTLALNRRGIEEVLTTELDRARRALTPLSVAIIDIDHFKTVNDAAGHAAGDDTLCAVANSIASNLRSYDACGRIGGDEFLVLLPGSHAIHAAPICERIVHQVASLDPDPASLVPTTISVGFTECAPGDTPDTILARADRALYSAKKDGRNCAHMEPVAPFNAPDTLATPIRTSSPPPHSN